MTNNVNNNGKAFKYLNWLRPKGFINLVAIDPVSDKITGITRNSKSPDLLAFIEKNNGAKNLYFMVNEPFEDAPDTKLTKKHVKAVHALYVDADPLKKKEFHEERARLKIFAQSLNDDKEFPATFVIDSGGGYQAFWKLDEPIKPDESIEEYGRGLAKKFKADAVQNIDRIMRLPYTWNLPTKLKLGREKALAKVVHGSQKLYSWDQLKNICPPEKTPEYESTDNVDFDFKQLTKDLSWRNFPDLEAKYYRLMMDDRKLKSLVYKDITKPSRSEYDFALAQQLKIAGWTLEETAVAMWLFPHGKGKELEKRDIVRAYSRAENPFAEMKISDEPLPVQKAPKEKKAEVEPEDKSKTKRLKLTHANEIEARRGGKPLLKGLYDQESMIVIYGQSNVGKSFITLDQSMHIALGKDWGKFKCRQKFAVLYIFAEAGNSAGRRIKATRMRLGIAPNCSEQEFPFYPITMDVNLREKPTKDRDDVNDIILLAKEAEQRSGFKVGLVVIDTLSTTFAGGNENSSEDVGAYITNTNLIKHNVICTTLTVHHAGKDQAQGARGHSSLRAATDTELEVKSEQMGDRWAREVVVKKQRDGEIGGKIKFALNVVEVGKDDDGDSITSCQVILETDNEFESVLPAPSIDLADELLLAYYAVYIAQETSNGHQNLVNAWAEYLYVNQVILNQDNIVKLIDERPVVKGLRKTELSTLSSKNLTRWLKTIEEKGFVKQKIIARETGNILWKIRE